MKSVVKPGIFIIGVIMQGSATLLAKHSNLKPDVM